MDEFYFSVNIDANRTLCLAPLTDRRLAMAGQELADTSGYFLFEQHGEGDFAKVEILAHVVSDDAVSRLRCQFNMS
ncbi:hypothetical protein FJ960_14215 [Mesorhizobium sp. B2-3-11]|uniref:hypothetical protein n=1 Tax=Mesorhizobium sp. B2-3-11 TaxID=2589953 RepID=UPI00112A80DF|nr:hypothetical protein [Mesorhizobium sp. B2-3-11]TPM03636.1 hypothetical protein FJ960_14215 [Mesorhizobium sp. B2-3-11]